MAYNIIRPRKGIKAMWDQYKGRIYKQGEMLVESPDTGVGTGPVNVKFGDGVSSYENLPYAIQAPTSELTEGSKAPMTAGAGFELKQLITGDLPVSDVQQAAINKAKSEANSYTDQKISNLINGAPSTLDTLKEIADAMAANEDVVEALEASIGSKAPSTHNHTTSDIIGMPTSLPASDVYSWAKQKTKPTYTASEVGAAPSSHNQSASTITAGTFKGDVAAPASTAFSTAHMTNHVIVDTKPTVGDSSTFPIGTYIHVKK